jgi:hypothetical protein
MILRDKEMRQIQYWNETRGAIVPANDKERKKRRHNSFYIGWLDFTLSSANGEVSIYDDRAN